jgi:DNA polymerase-3 subunit gamma/tau
MDRVTSLYRRHRPQSFGEVVGQAHIVRTMRNAVEQDKVHHAYLFVGSRGTGKTSIAKILARSLNCVNGPTLNPCGECESCLTITNSTSMDVIEMDAASNNSVDDIRDLREKVAFAPALGRWKVYIMDEAHMLSSAAWNAFLKTLEEPPPHTIFVLATTEAHKVPATIVDRCHRFDFQRPSLDDIVIVLKRIAEAEKIEADDRTLAMIARSAAGSFRDAIGTLDQIVTYGGKQITFEDVLEVLDVADADLIFKTTDAIAAHEPAAALASVRELTASGRDPIQFMRDITAHLRQIVVVQTVGEAPDSFSVTADQTDRLEAQAGALSQVDAVRAIDLVADALGAVREGSDPRIQLEVALLKASRPRADASLDALRARIEQLERGAGLVEGDAGKSSGGRTKRPRAPSQGGDASSEPPRERRSEPARAAQPPRREEAPRGGATAAVAEPAPADTEDAALPALETVWPALLERVREGDGGAMLAALLDGARPVSMDGSCFRLAFQRSAAFSKRKVEAQVNRRRITDAIHEVTGRSLTLELELADGTAQGGAGEALVDESELYERFKREFDAQDVLEEARPSEGDE